VVLELLAPHRVADDLRELVVEGAGAQRGAQIGLVHREQAGPQHALGGDADAVAVAAERLRDGGDEADLALAVGEAPAAGGRVLLALERLERVSRVDQRPDLLIRQHAVAIPLLVGVERHELDEAHLVRLRARELGEAHDLGLGEVAQRDDVDLDRAQLRVLLRGREAVEHLGQRVAPRELEEAVGRQRVQRDVDAAQPGAHEV
jgi:hypothetical protein